MQWAQARITVLLWVLVAGSNTQPSRGEGSGDASHLQVPAGFAIEKVAGPPLVRYPQFACFDDRGRLFVAEGTGTNLPGSELVKLPKQLGRITLLEDTNGDGVFDKSTTFADDLTFPTGVLWHDGIVYATSHPCLWRFEDKDGDGRAERREPLVRDFRFNGNGCDIHGPFLGPDGWLYWTDGRHGYRIETKEGECLEGLAARIWRCRTDGTGIERICGGGFDNPVELVFTAAGDLIGTMDQGPGDALLHYVEGGVYPMDHPCVSEFVRTGPMLGAVRQFSAALPVALCGLERYRSTHLGADYTDSLFTAQFNVHRIQQHRLERDGSTFRAIERDLVTSVDYDVHFTDVLEDGDGRLLVVDMGAWFNYGCPTSKIAKPEVLGAIYRVRRAGAPAVRDPWGQSIDWDGSATELARLLDDPRPKVRDRAIAQLARLGPAAVPALALVLEVQSKRSVEARRNALWALCRIRHSDSQAALRSGLRDAEPSVRQVAVHAVGLEKDALAAPILRELVTSEPPSIRLKAAEALGRLAQPAAAPALLESLRTGTDRFLEHAILYALIRIDSPAAVTAALSDPNPRVRRAGLIALDQMKAGELARDQVIPLLDTDDVDLQQAVLEVMSRRPGWSADVVERLRAWLSQGELSPEWERSLLGVLLGFCSDPAVQRMAAEQLANATTPVKTRLLILEAIGRCRLEPLPAPWQEALRTALLHADGPVVRAAVAAVKARGSSRFDDRLLALSATAALPAELRIAALDGIAARLPRLAPEAFALVQSHLSEKTEPLLRVSAARIAGAAPLDARQLQDLTSHVAQAGPMILPLLIPAYARTRDSGIGAAFVDALHSAPGVEGLAGDDLAAVLKGYPEAVRAQARPLLERLAARQADKGAYLAALTLKLVQVQPSPDRGREIFLSQKAGCYSCHRAAGQGGSVGPDLSQVGRFRTTRDLLESVVFPSSSIVPQFRSYVVASKDGRTTTGMILRETADEVFLRTSQLAEIRIARGEIEAMAPSNTSIMPEGLEKVLSPQELADLLEFLYHQR